MVRTSWQDDDERRVIEDVRQYGWHIVGVEEDQEGPAFAYSIGIYHTLKQPEIIVFGLSDIKLMWQIINGIGDDMRKGKTFEDWKEYDEILEGYSCMFRQVDQGFYREYVGYANRFYRPDEFPVLQCVWPDGLGRYPWHPEFPAALHARQPVLAQQGDWRFHEGKNRAAITTKYVFDGTHPILLVSHDEEGDWQFLCGTTNLPEDGRIVCLATVVERHPAVVELADLPVGWQAARDGVDQSWRRVQIKSDDEEQ
jgi:hypothetical protein